MLMTPVIRRSAFNVSPAAMDAAVQRFLQSTAATANNDSISQEGSTVTIQLDAPGLTREQLTIELEDQTVRLASVADAPRSLQRAWKLPAAIDAAQSTASLENGVLTLNLATHQPTPAVHKLVIT